MKSIGNVLIGSNAERLGIGTLRPGWRFYEEDTGEEWVVDEAGAAWIENVPASCVLRSEWLQNGFVDAAEVSLAWDDATRTLTVDAIGASFNYFHDGILYTKTSAQTKQIADTEGMWVFYFDAGTLSATHDPSHAEIDAVIENEAIVAYVYWDATNNDGRLMYELHGDRMSPATHHWIHDNVGSVYASGMALADFVIDDDGDDDVDAQFSVASGEFYDEDIENELAAVAKTTGLEIWYLDTTNWRWTTNAGFSILTTGTGRMAWNDGGAQRAGAETEINTLAFGTLPLQEIVPIATVIFQTNNGYGNAVKSRTVTTDAGDNYTDWRGSNIKASGGSVADHGALAGLADDDHQQYTLADGTRAFTGDIGHGGYAADNLSITDILELQFKTATELTISGGSVTRTQAFHTIDTESDAATDDLDTISGGAVGDLLIIRAAHTDRTVVLKHNTGNLFLRGAADIDMDDATTLYFFQYDTDSKWHDLGGGGGGGGASAWTDLTDTPANYTDKKGFFVQVNDAEDGLEFDEGTRETVRCFVQCDEGYNVTDAIALVREDRGFIMPDAKDCVGYGKFLVPPDFFSGLTVKAVITPANAGNVYSSNQADYGACAEAYDTHTDAIAAAAVAVTQVQCCIQEITLANEAIGDIVNLSYVREGTDVLDTIGGEIYLAGWIVEYTTTLNPGGVDCDFETTTVEVAGWEELDRDTLVGNQASFDFQNISQDYEDLLLVHRTRSDNAGDWDHMLMALNNDAINANYYRGTLESQDVAAAAYEAEDRIIAITPGATSPGGHFGNGHMLFRRYAESECHHVYGICVARRKLAQINNWLASIHWETAAAITRITYSPGVGNNWVAGSEMILYGLRKRDVVTEVTGQVTVTGTAVAKLSTTTGINAKTVAATTLYTVPAGKTLIPDHVVIRVTGFTVGAKAIQAVASFGGNGATYDDYLNSVTYTVAAVDVFIRDSVEDTAVAVQAAADVFKIAIETGSDATTETWAVDLFGYLV